MAEFDATQQQDDEDETEWFWSELDWDDIGEAFIGAFAAGLCLVLMLGIVMRRKRPRYMAGKGWLA